MRPSRRPVDETVLLCLLGLALVALSGIGLALALAPAHKPPQIDAPVPGFTLELAADGQSLLLTGSVDHGLTAALRNLLAHHPQITRITLESNGGNIYEARGAVNAVRAHGLNTHVAGHCASACALIFIAGQERELAPGAQLGFHGYAIAAADSYGLIDPAAELQRDLAVFRAQAVDAGFVEILGGLPVAPIWYPDPSDLHAAGVLTAR